MAITVTPTGAALGAEVGGVDLRSLSDADFAASHAINSVCNLGDYGIDLDLQRRWLSGGFR